jgi:hypothetical protein
MRGGWPRNRGLRALGRFAGAVAEAEVFSGRMVFTMTKVRFWTKW